MQRSENGRGQKRKRDDSSAATRPSPKSPNKQKPAAPSKKQKQGSDGNKAQQSKKATPAKPKPHPIRPHDPEDTDLAYLESKLGLSSETAKKRFQRELEDDGLDGTFFVLDVDLIRDSLTEYSRHIGWFIGYGLGRL